MPATSCAQAHISRFPHIVADCLPVVLPSLKLRRMSRSPDTISEMQLLEQRFFTEAPALLMRTMRLIEDWSTAEDLVLDAFRRLWKFRATYGMDRSVEEICLGQCLHYLDTSGARSLDKHRRDTQASQFREPPDESEDLHTKQIDVAAMWERVLVLLDADEHRREKYRSISESRPYRFVLYIAGMVIVVALLVVFFARNQQTASPPAPGTLTARTGTGDTTDLLFLNDVRLWLLPDTEVLYPDDLGTKALDLTVHGEVVVLVPESTGSPVVVRSEGHEFRLAGGRYRLEFSHSRLSATLHVGSGLATWVHQTTGGQEVEIREGQSLYVQFKDKNWKHTILDTDTQKEALFWSP